LEEKLLFSTSGYLKEIDLNSSVVKVLINAGSTVYSLTYDYYEKYLYVPRSQGDIIRFPYPSNQKIQFETVVSSRNPLGLAFDSVNHHLYWTDDVEGRIMRCNADGSNKTTVLVETEPAALTIDIKNRWMYYGQDLSNGKIYRLTFDGKDRKVIYNQSSHVLGIQVDVSNSRLYWMEYGTGDLKSAWHNGSDVKTIVSTHSIGRNWEIDTNDDFIFYSRYDTIFKINKSLGQGPTVVHTDTALIYAVFVFKQEGTGNNENEGVLYYTR
ncbi:Hypothetical predicted protein, partial [Mytilus galloprovincialis]